MPPTWRKIEKNSHINFAITTSTGSKWLVGGFLFEWLEVDATESFFGFASAVSCRPVWMLLIDFFFWPLHRQKTRQNSFDLTLGPQIFASTSIAQEHFVAFGPYRLCCCYTAIMRPNGANFGDFHIILSQIWSFSHGIPHDPPLQVKSFLAWPSHHSPPL